MNERRVTTDNSGEVLTNRCPVQNDGTYVGSSFCQWCIYFAGFKDSFETVVLCEAPDE